MTDNQILQDAIRLGIIDLATVRDQVEVMERQKYLEMHKYSIWQGANGKYYTKLPLQNNERRLIKKSTLEDVENAIIEHYRSSPSLTNTPTFESDFKKWVNEKVKLNEICQGTYDRYNTEFKRFFGGKAICNAPVREISESDLEDFIRTRIAELSLTSKAYGNMRTLIIGTFKYAKKHGHTNISITSFFGDLALSRRVFERHRKSDKEQIFSEEEVQKLVEYLKNHPSIENYGILLTFQCGIREGELSGLKFSDVDGNKLHIQRQEVKYKSQDKGKGVHEIVDYTKTDAGDRYIFLPNKALETIAKIRELNPDNEYMMMIGKRKIWTNTFNDRLYKACDMVGIPRRSMHKIRKTYGTMLIDSGAEESFIKAQMGHSDITTTKKYYYYSTKSDTHKLEQIERAIAF